MKIRLSLFVLIPVFLATGCTFSEMWGNLYTEENDLPGAEVADDRPSVLISMNDAMPIIKQEATRKDEAGAHYAMLLGGYEQSKGNYKAAEEAYTHAVASRPEMIRNRLALSDARLAQGHRLKALMTLADAGRVRPEDPKVLTAMASVLEPDRKNGTPGVRLAPGAKPAAKPAPAQPKIADLVPVTEPKAMNTGLDR